VPPPGPPGSRRPGVQSSERLLTLYGGRTGKTPRVARGNPRRPRDTAASDSLPLFPADVSDKVVSRRKERAAAANVVPMPRKAGPTPVDLARKAMAHQPTGASGKKVKLSLTVFLSREQAEKLTAHARSAKERISRRW
jgi:hypothetical protein